MIKNNSVIDQDVLAELTGYRRTAQIAAHLAKHDIPYYCGKRGRIWTTLDALNAGLGLSSGQCAKGQQRYLDDLVEVL